MITFCEAKIREGFKWRGMGLGKNTSLVIVKSHGYGPAHVLDGIQDPGVGLQSTIHREFNMRYNQVKERWDVANIYILESGEYKKLVFW